MKRSPLAWAMLLTCAACSVAGPSLQRATAAPPAPQPAASARSATQPSAVADRWALLVGCNSYPNFPADKQLQGCEADVRLVQGFLVRQFAVAPDRLRAVTGAEATREGILAGLNWLLASAKPGDALLFFYSGHGTRVPDKNGKLQKALCPCDTTRQGANVITGDEFNERLTNGAAGKQFTTILDCCHSGTGVRSLFGEMHVKYLPLDLPPPAAMRDVAPERDLIFQSDAYPPASDADSGEEGFGRMTVGGKGDAVAGGEPGAGQTGGAAQGPAGCILIAAARATEKAAEGMETVPPDGRREMHGLLTAEMARFLAVRQNIRDITYAAVASYLGRPLVSEEGNIQNPAVEAAPGLLPATFYAGAAGGPPALPAPAAPASPASPLAGGPDPYRPQPLRVAFRRLDRLGGGEGPHPATGWAGDLDPAAAEELAAALAKMLRAIPQEAVPAASDTAGANLFVFYGARIRGGSAEYAAAVVGSDALVGLQRIEPKAGAVADALRARIEHTWLVTNLVRLRQSPNAAMTVELRVENVPPSGVAGGGGTEGMPPRGAGASPAKPQDFGSQRARFRLGESVAFSIRPSADGYLTLINVTCDGQVRALYPNEFMKENKEGRVQAGQRLRVPGPGSGFDGDFPVEEPLGPESVKAVLTPRPLTEFVRLLGSGNGGAGAGSAGAESNAEFLTRGLENGMRSALGKGPAGASAADRESVWALFAGTDWAENTLLFTTAK